jgi:hypothetical protein
MAASGTLGFANGASLEKSRDQCPEPQNPGTDSNGRVDFGDVFREGYELCHFFMDLRPDNLSFA